MDPLAPSTSPINTVSPIRPKKSNKSLIIAVIVILALTIGATIFMKSRESSNTDQQVEISPTVEPLPTEVITQEPSVTPEETPAEEKNTTTPTPTSAPKAAATSAQTMNIQILNGSGETGVASTMKEHLSSKGYKYFETGNADNYDYTGVTIKIKSTTKQYLTTLQTDIGDKYTVSQDTATLPSDSTFDAVVIVGK